MRVVHIVEATATGTLAMVRMCTDYLASSGHQVHVIYSRREETPSNIDDLFHPNVVLHEMPMGGSYALSAASKLRRKLKLLEPEAIHLHSSIAGFIGRLASIGLPASSRIFYSPHCISVMREDIHHLKKFYALAERIANVNSATYIACSKSEQSAIRRWIGVDSVVLENAIPFNISVAAKDISAPVQRGQFQVACVGGIRPQKDPLMFAEICTRSRAAGLHGTFIWVGDGDNDLKQALLTAGVHVTGWCPRERVYSILSETNVFLSTSKWEGMPVSVIEAMASGVVPIVRMCAGNVDIVSNNVDGLLFSSVPEAIKAIKCVSDNQPHWNSVIERRHRHWRERFSQARFEKDLGEIYRNHGIAL